RGRSASVSWPGARPGLRSGVNRPSRPEERCAFRIGITGTSPVMTNGEGAPLTRCAGAHSTPPHRRGGERAAYREGQRTPGRSALLIGWSATQESRLRDRFTRIALVLALVLLAA